MNQQSSILQANQVPISKEITKKSFEMLNECPWFSMKKVTKLIGLLFDEKLKPIGTRSNQVYLLASLTTLDESSINSIAKVMGSDQTTISRNVQVLEKLGQLEIVQGADRRTKLVNITHKGVDILNKAYPIWFNLKNQIIQVVGEEDALQLNLSLEKILAFPKTTES